MRMKKIKRGLEVGREKKTANYRALFRSLRRSGAGNKSQTLLDVQ